jgi:L-ascorbate metabolism protein UlaG (beta-lactamase superfamily)
MEGFTFLTDPVWSARASPVQFFGPKRFVNPPVELEVLPKVDLVFVSHTHYDHLDYGTIRRLQVAHPNAKYIVGIGLKKWFTGECRSFGFLLIVTHCS